jgi:serine/threonine protein kinase
MDESGQLRPSVDPQVEHVLSEYSRRIAAGDPISPSDLISQNPAVADALRSHFAVAGGERAEAASSDEGDASGTHYVRIASQATIPPRKPAVAQPLPERFGRYNVVRSLGSGAMGDVYLADDTQLDRPVALKIPRFSNDRDDELIERFYREARAAATVRHPNLCPVYDAGEIDGIHYLSMAFIEGRPLCDLLSTKKRFAPRDAATLILKLAKALNAAHSSGVIHRDLKPANIMIDSHDEPIIMDFGLSRRTNKEDSRLTQSGLVMGSPAYMSPEQVEGESEKIGPSSDIYSLGIVFYELLTGQVPFSGSIASVLGQIVTTTAKKPSTLVRSIDPTLEAICLKMIAKRPEDRFESMRDIANALEAYLSGRATGVVVPARESAGVEPERPVRHSGGIVIAPWMLWTAIVIVLGGFGITWQLIAMMMRGQASSGEIAVSQPFKDALSKGEANILVNQEPLQDNQLRKPIVLPEGDNNVQIKKGSELTPNKVIHSEKDNPTVLEKTSDGDISYSPLRRRIAEQVLAQKGQIKVAGSDVAITRAADLPTGRVGIDEIDLSAVQSIDAIDFDLIKRLKASLKRLVVPKGFLQSQIQGLAEALPNCEIQPAPETP